MRVPEAEERTIAPGDSVRVTIQVETHGAVACDSLRLELGWRTHGRGDREQEIAWTRSLFSGSLTAGDWAAGERLEFECEAPIPQGGPATHHGEHFNVDWHLTASVHEGSAVTASREFPLIVATPPPADAYTAPEVITVEPIRWNAGKRFHWLPGIALMGASLVVGSRAPLLALPILLGGGVLTFFSWRRAQAAFRYRAVEFGHWPKQVVPGAEFRVFLAAPGEAAAAIAASTWTLTAIEKATSKAGTEVTHFTRTAYAETLQTGGGGAPPAGQEPGHSERIETVFHVPLDAPNPLELQHHSVRWEVRLSVREGAGQELSFSCPLGT